jgi:hypothetical protein
MEGDSSHWPEPVETEDPGPIRRLGRAASGYAGALIGSLLLTAVVVEGTGCVYWDRPRCPAGRYIYVDGICRDPGYRPGHWQYPHRGTWDDPHGHGRRRGR